MKPELLTLTEIGLRHGSDKFTIHGFQTIYEAFLEPRRQRSLKLLEIGIGGEDLASGGASLFTWQEYLPNSLVYGLDIFDKSSLDNDRIKTIVCDQADRGGLLKVCRDHGPFDVIIDDGNHMGPDVAMAFFTLFEQLTPGGLYFLEDIQTSYWPNYRGSSVINGCYDSGVRWAKLAIDIINRGEILDRSYFPANLNLAISELHVFHNMAVFVREPIGYDFRSRALKSEHRINLLQTDQTIHSGLGEIYQELLSDPGKFRLLIEAVKAYGGLDRFIANFGANIHSE